ncbi:hypothetical protein [uncultured Rikenella sp.]|uniref:hypothetical protein n=1 Tax=uncultured Rikenella sp. TaxID=368003 RepID=UPI0026262247|nr:hypothetical protein [uncultured Rikenella sp.]
MQQLIFVQPIPLTSVKEKMFYLQELISAGFHVQFWNLAPFTFPKLRLTDQIEPNYNINIQSFSELVDLLEQTDVSRTLFIADLDEGWMNRHLLLLFKQKKCILWRIYVHTTIGCNQFTLWQNFRYLLRQNVSQAFKYAVRGIQYKLLMYRHGFFGNPYDKFISSGNNPHIDQAINHYDWEQYKRIQQLPSIIDGTYAVFIDQYFPLHPEYQHKQPDSNSDAIRHYQELMCRFFDHMERLHNVKIVIAAHPQAKYAANQFGNRLIIKYKTAELINHADFVIMHGSAAIGYAVMADKPIIFVTTDYYNSFTRPFAHLKDLSRRFSLPLYNLDHITLSDVEPQKADSKVRKNYLYHYLTTIGIETDSSLQILINLFNQI